MKKIFSKIITITLLLCFITVNPSAHTKPTEVSFSDYSGIISNGVKDYVKQKNKLLYEKTDAKIIFVTTDETDGLSISDYTKKLYSSWNIANMGRGNSVFVVISSNTNEYEFIQGKNIRRILNDSVLYNIISNDFEPIFAKGDYDVAVIKLYNSLGRWYEENYQGLDLSLDDNAQNYISTEKTKDVDIKKNNVWLWICSGAGLILILVFFNIKRKADFKSRQNERRIKRKRNKADIDKIVNS